MRCTCYCTAASYDIIRLFQSFQRLGAAQLFRNVVHTKAKEKTSKEGDVFYFSYGVLVCWGFTEEEEKEICSFVKPFEKEPLLKNELDEFSYSYNHTNKIEEDNIFLHDETTLTKLAISHGIAQSVKLSTFEELIQKTIELTTQIPQALAKKGKIPFSRKQIFAKMGEILTERNFINLHSEVLDTPEFFWDYPELEPYFRRTVHYLDVIKRVDTLNKRLNVVHDLFEILSSEANHRHTVRLEAIIVLLILIEVLLALLRDVFHVF